MTVKNLFKKNQLMITALAIMIAIAGYLQFAGEDLGEEYMTVNDDTVYSEGTSAVDSDRVVAEDYTTQELLDLSEEDLLKQGLTEIESLDSDLENLAVGNYLEEGLQTADAGQSAAEGQLADAGQSTAEGQLADAEQSAAQGQLADAGQAMPEDGEIPGEAVFTSGDNVAVLSEAKLLKEQTRAKNKETLLEIINSTGLTDEQKQTAVDSMVEMTAIAEKEAAAEILLEAKGFTDVVVSINGDAVDVVVNASVLDDAMRAQIEDIVKRKTEVEAENIIISTMD